MSTAEQAGLVVSAITIALAYIGSIRWLVKHYLSELKPNSSKSLKDQVTRLEERVDQIMFLLIEASNKPKRKTKEKENG